MAVILLSSSGYTWGIPLADTGIKNASYTEDREPEFREPRHGLQNQIEGWAIGPIQRTVTITGEVNASGGLMASTPFAVYVPVNLTTLFGGGSGGFYQVSSNVSYGRGSWMEATATFQSNEGVT